jgi:2-polyprenyl-3-methyl-5-hydroxy-6-metoxy-1,4-benzoquinol methylase
MPRTREDIVAEYTAADEAPTPHQRAKWGSATGMYNRFRLALELIDWRSVRRWCDVGCGEGAFFAMAAGRGLRFDALVGVDVTAVALQRARARSYGSPARFDLAAIEHWHTDVLFDALTLVGVLQQSSAQPAVILTAAALCLRPGGQLFLTTKNLGWAAFANGTLEPDPSHSWFNAEDIVQAASASGVDVEGCGGYLPRTGQRVAVHESHTLFLHGVRR